MENKIKHIMAEVFVCDINDITEATTKDDLENWDSLQHMIFISKLEQELQISFTPDEIGTMLSYIAIFSVVKSKL
ncbi:MAG: acyl carrier protein [Ignavibacteria bacterium]|nr:acyl carrier protein [Ignavibacteria bacterium]